MLKLYSSDHIVKVLFRHGFIISQKGSHAKFRKTANPTYTVIVPMARKEIPIRTFKSILRQAHLTEENFILPKAK